MAGIAPRRRRLRAHDNFHQRGAALSRGARLCKKGEDRRLLRRGRLAPGGSLPSMTSGAVLSKPSGGARIPAAGSGGAPAARDSGDARWSGAAGDPPSPCAPARHRLLDRVTVVLCLLKPNPGPGLVGRRIADPTHRILLGRLPSRRLVVPRCSAAERACATTSSIRGRSCLSCESIDLGLGSRARGRGRDLLDHHGPLAGVGRACRRPTSWAIVALDEGPLLLTNIVG